MIAKMLTLLRANALWLGLGGGLIFVLLFLWAYKQLDPAAYQNRDDGVITLSHARNWIDYGHIAAEPSGQRSEGFSSPLQFWLYALAYALTGCGWAAFSAFQTWACTFGIGFLFIQFWERKPWLGLFGTTLAGLILTACYRFVGWHGSGMENAWMHLVDLASIYLLWRMWTQGKILWTTSLVLFAASIARTEAIFHIFPLLMVFTFAWTSEYRNAKAWAFGSLVLLLWTTYQLWRYCYFGTWVPNTGVVQAIHPTENLRALWDGQGHPLALGGRWALEILRAHGVWILGLSFGLLPWTKIDREGKMLLSLVGVLVFTALLNPFIFGQTRLDPARSTTFVALVAALGTTFVLTKFQWSSIGKLFPLLIGLALVFRALSLAWLEAPRDLCCPVEGHKEIATYADAYSATTGVKRLTVSTPDLGKLSYLKRYNIADLGYLGSPILARLATRTDDFARYFYEFVAPEVIEVHGPWMLEHGRLLSDPRFKEHYHPLCGSQDPAAPYATLYPDLEEGIFVRKDLYKAQATPEADLIARLQADLKLNHIKAALQTSVDTATPTRHQYVVRTAYRLLPEFRAAGLSDSLVALFAHTPTAPYDQAILSSAQNRNWLREAFTFLDPFLRKQRLREHRKAMGGLGFILHEHGRWRFYLRPDRKLIVSVLSPNWGEWMGDCLIHIGPKDKVFAKSLNRYGVHFNEFKIHWECAEKVGEEFFFATELPKWPIEYLRLGIRKDGALKWVDEVKWPTYFR